MTQPPFRSKRLPASLCRACVAGLCLLWLALAGSVDAADRPAKLLFGAVSDPSASAPLSIGSYAKGCLAGAVELPETGASWQAMRLSRNRNWGHPQTIAFIARMGAAAQQVGWKGVYVGDISQPRGGPMRSGHASHQIGLDIDVWMLPPKRLNLNRQERETLSSINVRSGDQMSVTGNWTPQHQALLRKVAEDGAVARVFITAVAKQAMCRDTDPADRAWLRKIRPWWGHNEHFHVRLECPAGSPDCAAQDPIPEGDGCDASLDWWTSDEALNPPPAKDPAPPKPELTLASLPDQCRAVLGAP